MPDPIPMLLIPWPSGWPDGQPLPSLAAVPGLHIAADPLRDATAGAATLCPLSRALIYWLGRHHFPQRLLPVLRQHTRPTLLVTDHLRMAVGLAPHCPALRIICTPERAETDFQLLLRLLPHLSGGPLVLPTHPARHARRKDDR
jgi:hypothetical protein